MSTPEEAIEDRYTRMHQDPTNMAMRMDRKRMGLTGVWEEDVAAGRVRRTEDAYEYVPPTERTVLP